VEPAPEPPLALGRRYRRQCDRGSTFANLRNEVLAAAVVFAALAGSAAAQTQVLDEVKFGVLAHDVALFDEHVENGADINFEALLTSPDFLAFIGSPRPHLGGSVNTAGNTSVGYFGLTWGITLLENLWASGDGVFVNGSLGGALQNGYTNTAPPGRKTLGTTALFRESLELGYRVTPTLSVSAYLDHMSNANLAAQNAGLTDAGIRFGLKF
jgi:lipid A 3-O-deacylase